MPSHPLEAQAEPFFVNHLYDRNFFYQELPLRFPPAGESEEVFLVLNKLAGALNFAQLNENQLEHQFIRPVLEVLGWSCLPQVTRIIQGKELKPDWCLFSGAHQLEEFLSDPDSLFPSGTVLCEAKAAGRPLDTRKAAKSDNPYVQLLEYLTYSRQPYGFLTNGDEWWLVDNSRLSSKKRYLRVNLTAVLAAGNQHAFRYFHLLFSRDAYAPGKDKAPTAIEAVRLSEEAARIKLEDDLRSVIYGTDGRDSLFERIGQALLASSGGVSAPDNLRDIFENSLYLVFRLLFIANFEDRYAEQLTAHEYYRNLSLRSIHARLGASLPPHAGWRALKVLFDTLDGGSAAMGIPLLNGGLFDASKATLLNTHTALDNDSLKAVLDDLLLYGGRLLRRDYRNLSATHLGGIYEGLLDYEFRVDAQVRIYLEYTSGAETLSGYFDVYDATAIKNDRRTEVLAERRYEAGVLYLVNTRNTRKSSGSYYTPSSLSVPLVRRAIDHQLDRGMSPLDLRILDNACGSGHLLIDALDYLTRKALEKLEHDAALARHLADEKAKIESSFQRYRDLLGSFELDVDELAVLKRILLKRVIYGVDMQPFAVELAQLALWVDTFVFGTPLSFIDHHVKAGNSLIGTTIERFRDFVAPRQQFGLLQDDLNQRFRTLHEVFQKLSAIRDTTPEEVKQSAEVYRREIRPVLDELDRALDVVNHHDMLLCEGRKKEAHALKNLKHLGPTLLQGKDNALALKIADSKERYRFFNWEVEFPEAFAGEGPKGFHVIVGNPPWDKTKFLDPDFFSQYRSNYRSLSNEAKAALQTDLLADPDIRARYDQGKAWAKAVNNYYKGHYPLNAGSGDGNLFRFLVERNLALLLPGGTLNYVLPTGFLTEEGSDGLRRHIFENFRLNRFDGFENRNRLFPEVDSRYKFGLIQLEHMHDASQSARVRFMLTDPVSLSDDQGAFDYSLEDIRITSPEHMAYMEVGAGRKDLDILLRLYRAFSPLRREWMDFRNELHATNDKSIFLETTNFDGLLPLYKGASVWQYDSLYAEPEYWLDPAAFDAHLLEKEINRLIRDIHPQLPAPGGISQAEDVLSALGLKKKTELARFIAPDRLYYRLSFRDIARDTDERTLIAAMIPKQVGAQNTLWVSIPKRYILSENRSIVLHDVSPTRLLFAQAVFNALVPDWILRFCVAIHVNKTYLMRIPFPQPTDDELHDNPLYSELVLNSLKLSLHFNPSGFEELRTEFDIDPSTVPKTDKQVDLLKIRNDCLVAALYGVTPQEFDHMLGSFKVLNRLKPQYVAALKEAYARHQCT